MIPFRDGFPVALVGTVFTALGLFKLNRLRRGMVGGRGKPAWDRLCGT